MIVIAQKEILALKLWLGKRAQCGARIERIAQRSAQGVEAHQRKEDDIPGRNICNGG
jgi:hypothetical protein